MERVCVFSDVHADLAATESILADAREHGIERFWCLGDFASGGPQPLETYELVMEQCELVLAGNHEFFITEIDGPNFVLRGGWADAARAARHQLGEERTAQLMRLPLEISGTAVELVHASLTDPLFDVIDSPATAEANFLKLLSATRLLLFGHTHRAAHWWQVQELPVVARRQRVRLNQPIDISERRCLINPGAGCDATGARWLELELTDEGVPQTATWRRASTRGLRE
jgi:predicted phosphodiesterase